MKGVMLAVCRVSQLVSAAERGILSGMRHLREKGPRLRERPGSSKDVQRARLKTRRPSRHSRAKRRR